MLSRTSMSCSSRKWKIRMLEVPAREWMQVVIIDNLFCSIKRAYECLRYAHENGCGLRLTRDAKGEECLYVTEHAK